MILAKALARAHDSLRRAGDIRLGCCVVVLAAVLAASSSLSTTAVASTSQTTLTVPRTPVSLTTSTTPTTPTTVHGLNPVPTTQRPPRTGTTTPVPPAAQSTVTLTKLAFFNAISGYGLFNSQSQTTCGALVASTSDGGSVFGELIPVNTWPCSGSPQVGALAFDDHGDGFAYGPELFITHDYGATWIQLAQPGQVLSVEALGSSIWMVEAGCPLSTNPQQLCPLQLLESEDGGSSWSPVAAPVGLSMDNGYSASSGQTWLLRVGQTAAYLSANLPFNALGAGANDAPLWFTSDSGRTWSSRPIPCGPLAFTVALSAAPDGTLFAVCAGQPSAGSSLKSVLESTNDGFTWTVMLPCPPASIASGSGSLNCATSPLANGYLGEIDAISDSTVFLAGSRSPLLVTRDGGSTWAQVAPTIADGADYTSSVTFFNSSVGVVLGNDGQRDTIWSTSDGGLLWHSVLPVTPSVPQAATAQLSRCSLSSVSASTSPAAVGLGHVGVVLIFTDKRSPPCTLRGYPLVVLSEHRVTHTLLGYLGGLEGTSMLPTITLSPGQSASALLEGSDINRSGQRCSKVTALGVGLPGSTNSTRVQLERSSEMTVCGGLEVHPLLGGASGTLLLSDPCAASMLGVHGGRQGEAGTAEGTIVVTNFGGTTCTLSVDPVLTLLDSRGSPLPVSSGSPFRPSQPLWLSPGESAALITSWSNWCHGDPGPLQIEIQLPDNIGLVTGTFDGPPGFQAIPTCDSAARPSQIRTVDSYLRWTD